MSSLHSADTELLEAAKVGDLSRVNALVKQWRTKSTNSSDSTVLNLRQPLVESLVANQAQVVSYLLDQGAELDSHIVTLAPVKETSMDMFQVFLDHGWDINSITSNSAPRLKDVVAFEPLVRFFLAHGADPNACGSRHFNILDVAAASSSPVVFDLLLQYGANLDGSDALHAAAGAGEGSTERLGMLSYILDTVKLEINAIAKHGPPAGRGLGRGTPLHSAIFVQAKDRMKFLLDMGANPETRNTLGQTALEFAMEWDLTESVELLKEH